MDFVDRHEDEASKIALCVNSCTLAKTEAVSEFGIGEELTFTVFGWLDSRLLVVAQLHPSHMKADPDLRLKKVYFCASLMRKAWGVDEITFAAEGYWSNDADSSRGRSLAEMFAAADQSVGECLTFLHVSKDESSLVVVPYRLVIGRKVEWGEAHKHDSNSGFRDSAYANALSEALEVEPEGPVPDQEIFDKAIIDGLIQQGFAVQYIPLQW